MQLTLQDLAMVVNFIDAATERGAIKGGELYNIGQLREKFASIVIEAQKANEQSTTTAETFDPNA
jgi:hypothetical protein